MSNTKDALKHYGYPEDTPDKDVGIGLWDKSDALDRLAKLPEMLPHLDGNKKIRVVFDYDPTYPVCPICEQTCETIYISADNEIVGCDQCMTTRNALEVTECFGE